MAFGHIQFSHQHHCGEKWRDDKHVRTYKKLLPSKSLWIASILVYGCGTDSVVTELSTL